MRDLKRWLTVARNDMASNTKRNIQRIACLPWPPAANRATMLDVSILETGMELLSSLMAASVEEKPT